MTSLKDALANSANVGDINATGYISGKKSSVFAYISTPAATTITTAGTYYPLAGTFTNTPMDDFIVTADPAIQYKGTKTQKFEIDWQASAQCDNNGRSCHIGIGKNLSATPEASSIMCTYLKVATESQAFAGSAVIELATDDKIQILVTSSVNGDQITATHFTTSIRKFDD